ncbi:MAG: hypothetical protein MI922_19415 [Bacteroidales bacterium]|nr:hypothetical protein [Bacteroidales bacterium]
MKKEDVPQDDANMLGGVTRDVQYALDDDGKYVQVKSVGWEPKNVVMQQAWNHENEKIEQAREQVKNGEKSPLYYHMYRCLMTKKLVSAYTGYSRLKINKHFKPKVYEKLSDKILDKYVYAFGLKSVDELNNID